MSERLADRFAARLLVLEQSRDPAALNELLAAEVELQRKPTQRTYRGHEGAREFWSEYLAMFPEVRTEFTAISEGDGRATLEWQTSCRLSDGATIRYDGCTILELHGDVVTRLRTYYDSAAVLGQTGKK
jgi:ketosteroid isomerase-like protein